MGESRCWKQYFGWSRILSTVNGEVVSNLESRLRFRRWRPKRNWRTYKQYSRRVEGQPSEKENKDDQQYESQNEKSQYCGWSMALRENSILDDPEYWAPSMVRWSQTWKADWGSEDEDQKEIGRLTSSVEGQPSEKENEDDRQYESQKWERSVLWMIHGTERKQ